MCIYVFIYLYVYADSHIDDQGRMLCVMSRICINHTAHIWMGHLYTHTHTHTHTQTQGERQCYGWPHRRWGPREFDRRWWSWSHISRSTRGRRRRRRATGAGACWTGHSFFYKFGLEILHTRLYVIRPAISLRKIWVGIYEFIMFFMWVRLRRERGWLNESESLYLWLGEYIAIRAAPHARTHTHDENIQRIRSCEIYV